MLPTLLAIALAAGPDAGEPQHRRYEFVHGPFQPDGGCQGFAVESSDGGLILWSSGALEPPDGGGEDRYQLTVDVDRTDGGFRLHRLQRVLKRPHPVVDAFPCDGEVVLAPDYAQCLAPTVVAKPLTDCLRKLPPPPPPPNTTQRLARFLRGMPTFYWLSQNLRGEAACRKWKFTHPDKVVHVEKLPGDATVVVHYGLAVDSDHLVLSGPGSTVYESGAMTDTGESMCLALPAVDDLAPGEYRVGDTRWFETREACERALAAHAEVGRMHCGE